jgi:hypothetical protein
MVCGKRNDVAFWGECDEQHESITGTIYPVSHLVKGFLVSNVWKSPYDVYSASGHCETLLVLTV